MSNSQKKFSSAFGHKPTYESQKRAAGDCWQEKKSPAKAGLSFIVMKLGI
jgi:hypothetical protein